MGRAPCCDKMGVKKGPWTAGEDRTLIDFIHRNGHGNWRALPKQAGLLRCGKSCRLRWINYLRPDIKRGNFSYEEEEAIIKLHQLLGNRWSAIASRLPGRTDNEIKNVWNTHLKKRLLQGKTNPVTHSVATMAEHNQILLDYSECSETDPSMEKDMLVHNSALTQQEVSVDYPTTNISSDDLSSEIFSSPHNETANSDSTLDCIQLAECNDSFNIELEYQQYPITTEDHPKCNEFVIDETFIMENLNFGDEEKNSPWQSSEDLYLISACEENDLLNNICGENSNTHLLWNEEFQAYDDDCESMVYWLSILGQAGPSPMLQNIYPLLNPE